jgi:hypothetical protein
MNVGIGIITTKLISILITIIIILMKLNFKFLFQYLVYYLYYFEKNMYIYYFTSLTSRLNL